MINLFIKFMEQGHLPDPIIRLGVRKLCQDRLALLQVGSLEKKIEQEQDYRKSLVDSPLAVHTREANEQHYELPPEFFILSLGKHLKYSCAYFPEGVTSLDEAERLSLELTVERGEIQDGMRILELGCGWGSLTLFMAAKFPGSKIVAISNSAPQKAHIDAEAKKRGLTNITVLTRDVSQLESLALEFDSFDRVMSVEMFEHFKNYKMLLRKISDVLAPGGKLFVHIFSHREYSYPFETEGDDNWMGKYFFTGGQMPAHHLLPSFQDDLSLEHAWAWDGTHYQKTSEAWLAKMDENGERIKQLFVETYGKDSVAWYNRWRVFYLSVAEFFGFENGSQWGVSHYRFVKD